MLVRKQFDRVLIAAAISLGSLALCALSGCARPVSASPHPNNTAANEIREKLMVGSSAEGAGAVESTGTGWATLKGRFKFDGSPPAPGRLVADKDTEVCGRGGSIPDNSLLVASDGGIANV